MTLAVAITTAPREEYWLSRSVEGLRRGGFAGPYTICAEPDSLITNDVREHAVIVQNATRLGAWQNWLAAVGHALSHPTADGVLIVQDDGLLCRDAADWLSFHLWPSERCGCVSVYTSRGYRGYTERGLQRLPERFCADFWGAVVLALSREAAKAVLQYAETHGWRGHATATVRDPVEKRAIDAFVGVAMQALGYEIWICNPSLARHDVEFSTLGHGQSLGQRRRALDYQGDDVSAWKAMAD